MGFKDPENSVKFCLLTIFILFGISNFILIGNAVHMQSFRETNMTLEEKYFTSKYVNVFPDYWRIDLFDNKITQVENIIIGICNLWGFLRIIDLIRHLNKI